MTPAHTEFLAFYQSLKFQAEEDRALACWMEARRVALLDAMQVSRFCVTGDAAFKLIGALK